MYLCVFSYHVMYRILATGKYLVGISIAMYLFNKKTE